MNNIELEMFLKLIFMFRLQEFADTNILKQQKKTKPMAFVAPEKDQKPSERKGFVM